MKASPSNLSRIITDWRPDDNEFWQHQGQRIAKRNLWISVPCLLLAFCVWVLFSVITVNLNKAGFHFTTTELFTLTALPSLSGAILRIPYSFVIPIVGGRRWTTASTLFLIIPCIWLGFAVQNPATHYSIFIIIALLCGFAGANFASSMANISFFFPKKLQGSALGINGGLGNLGVSVMQVVAPFVISIGLFSFLHNANYPVANEGTLWLENAAWIWVPFLIIFSIIAYFGMNDIATNKASLSQQIPILAKGHMWILSVLYLATFGSFIGFSAGFAMLAKTQFPTIIILHYAFLGPLLGALARPVGGMLSDKLGGIRITLINFIFMAIFSALIFATLPAQGANGSFMTFYIIFMLLFLTAGLGSGSTFQMISVVFRQKMLTQFLAQGVNLVDAQKRSGTDTAAALGFISAIGALGGYFIPQIFGASLSITGSPADAMMAFLIFYIICILITWFVYGGKKSHPKQVQKESTRGAS